MITCVSTVMVKGGTTKDLQNMTSRNMKRREEKKEVIYGSWREREREGVQLAVFFFDTKRRDGQQ